MQMELESQEGEGSSNPGQAASGESKKKKPKKKKKAFNPWKAPDSLEVLTVEKTEEEKGQPDKSMR